MNIKDLLKEIVLFLWQLPQNVLGAFIVLLTRAEKVFTFATGKRKWFYVTDVAVFGISLGHFIIFGVKGNEYPYKNDILHEIGHQKQSRILGPLYLIVIGIPSFVYNRWDALMHRRWAWNRRLLWYYGHPWEAWADKLGGVEKQEGLYAN